MPFSINFVFFILKEEKGMHAFDKFLPLYSIKKIKLHVDTWIIFMRQSLVN